MHNGKHKCLYGKRGTGWRQRVKSDDKMTLMLRFEQFKIVGHQLLGALDVEGIEKRKLEAERLQKNHEVLVSG
jgi:hypothetical protein